MRDFSSGKVSNARGIPKCLPQNKASMLPQYSNDKDSVDCQCPVAKVLSIPGRCTSCGHKRKILRRQSLHSQTGYTGTSEGSRGPGFESQIMKSASQTNNRHADWVPVMEVASREVFELMLGCNLTVPETPSVPQLNVTSMVGLAGKLCGVLTVRCDRKSAALMTSKMLGVELEKVGEQITDAMGEIANMVAGNFKNKISDLGNNCMLSTPTVITGGDYDVHFMADSPGLQLNLLFEGMPIVISLRIHG
jgi:chemotaxis protein CheX